DGLGPGPHHHAPPRHAGPPLAPPLADGQGRLRADGSRPGPDPRALIPPGPEPGGPDGRDPAPPDLAPPLAPPRVPALASPADAATPSGPDGAGVPSRPGATTF